MGEFANLEGLKNFRKKLERLEDNLPSLARRILTKICEYGVTYATSLYNSSENIKVNYELLSDNSAKIIANGVKVAYLEFGTGERGRSTYEGNLPDQTISFYSNRLHQDVTLNGWVYSYAHEIDQQQNLWGGFAAQAQMWKTSQYLRQVIPQIIKEVSVK
jgi:hypothetical protein